MFEARNKTFKEMINDEEMSMAIKLKERRKKKARTEKAYETKWKEKSNLK